MIKDVTYFSANRLTEILRNGLNAPNLVVSDVTVEALSLKAAYNAQLFRLTLTYHHSMPAAPATLIAKLPSGNEELAENCVVFQPGTKEEWFYRAVAPTDCVTAPKCYFGVAERTTGQATLLLADLGELEATSQTTGMSINEATLALQEAARLHARWWNQEEGSSLADLRDLNSNSREGIALVDRLYGEAWPFFLQNSEFPIPAAVKAFGASLFGRGEQINTLCRTSPKTVLHGDFRVDNMLFDDRGDLRKCYVLDWESVNIGCGVADIAWLIAGCVPGIETNQESDLLKSYHTALLANGVRAYAYEQCALDYRRSMIEQFVQGVLSGTIYDPATATTDIRAFARAIGERFVAAAERLSLHELL